MSSSDATPPPAARSRAAEAAWTAATAAVALAVYVATLCPTVYTLDAPELTAAAATFGVAHPPGYPLFTMLYGALARVLPFDDVALRTNVVNALLAAATVGAVFRCGRALGASRAASAAGALGIAVARDWWAQGVSTEVYALDGLLLASSVLAAARVGRDASRRSFALLGLAFGLACGHRAVNVVFLLALLAWVELSRRRAGAAVSRYAVFVACGVATAAVWLYLPIAASADPPMNMGDPSDPSRLWVVITAAPYARHLASTTGALVLGRVGQYAVSLPLQLAATAVAAIAGIVLLRRRGAAPGAAGTCVAAFAALNLLFVVLFNIPDGESFLQATWISAGALGAVGYDALARRLGAAGPAAAVALALAPAAWTWSVADLSGVRTVETYGRDLLDSAGPGALIVAYDDNARNAMVFQQVVRGHGTDRAVVDVSAPLPWHQDETRRRTHEFDFAGESGEGWIARLARRFASDPAHGVYLTDIAGVDLASLLGPELAERAALVPTGLLFRVIVSPPGRDAGEERLAVAAATDARFWPTRSIDAPARAHHDPQLASIVVRSAQARFLLAVTYALAGRVDAAVPHLEALAAMDVDTLEMLVIEDLSTIGPAPEAWRLVERSRRALEAVRRGAPPPEVVQALAPR